MKGPEKLGLLSGECVLVQGEERKVTCAFTDNLNSQDYKRGGHRPYDTWSKKITFVHVHSMFIAPLETTSLPFRRDVCVCWNIAQASKKESLLVVTIWKKQEGIN